MKIRKPFSCLPATFGLILATLGPGPSTPLWALDNGLALTPPMGWNSWNKFGTNVDETIIRGMADAMVTNGYAAAGYQFINIDDSWQSSRGTNGVIVANPTRFPSGIAALAAYVHSKGLKLGIYSDRGTETCGGYPGSEGHVVLDADTYAEWGVDYLKYDNCNASQSTMESDYQAMSAALTNSGRPIVFSICAWQFLNWMPETGNLWRTTVDIQDNWTSMISNLENNAGLAPHAGPGHWNDPDMLEVGNGGMTATEYQTHFTMWCMMAAPLILGNDLRNTSAAYVEILTNAEVIALDQDVAGIQGTRVAKNGNWEVWCKPLGSTNGGLKAAALLNLGTATASIQVTWQEIGLAGYAAVRDLWAHQDLGWFGNSFTASVPAHGVVALKITAGTAPTLSILSAQPPIQLRLLGVSNALTVVQRSIDLENWIPFLTNTPASNVWDFFDTNAPALQMFYRFVLQ